MSAAPVVASPVASVPEAAASGVSAAASRSPTGVVPPSAEAAAPVGRSVPEAAASGVSAAASRSPTGVVPPSAEATVPVVAAVTVPDLAGLSVRTARKQLRALGLKMSVRDGYGESIPARDWSMFKVRAQAIEGGAEVEPGTRIRLRAKPRRRRRLKGY